ncbi:MAG: TetR/AcrR family transcriptional regulator [Proteobacteria bacterium]|nr:TetR/AcrR family transcriptional regulator [Pseudomonadota bacterium]
MISTTEPVTKKEKILKTAVEIFCKKGKKSTIAEIGAGAEVTDSIIYHYFKNKEDLLFHAAGEQLKEMTALVIDQLKDIHDPVDKIRKFAWYQLYFHDINPHYTNLTVFECRTNKSFFDHEAFQYFRDWTRILKDIVTDGICSGVFHPSVDIPIFRDAFFGLLDMESIHSLAAFETENVQNDVDDILYLLLPVLTNYFCPKANQLTKSERILFAAETIFAEKGYDSTTMIDISLMAKVAEGTIYEYFKNKDDLLFSTLQHRIRKNNIVLSDVTSNQNPFSRLRFFIQNHLFHFIDHPEFMKIFLFDGIFNRKFYKSKAAPDFIKYVETLYPILDEGKKDGSFKPDINNRVFKNIFLGLTSHMALRWHHKTGITEPIKFQEMKKAIQMLLRAVTNE